MNSPSTIPTTEQVGGHTPTPWKVDPRYCDDIVGSDGRDVAETCLGSVYMRPADERRANAEFIVRAVNERDALVAALKWALPLAEIAMEDHRSHRCQAGHGGTIQGTYSNGVTWAGIYQGEVDEIELARATLAKAVKS